MITALDSSVIVAALAGWHEEHDRSHRVVARLLSADEQLVVPDHALIEAYSVLTRLPVGYRISPADARDLLRDAFHGRARVVETQPAEGWAVVDRAGAGRVAGGAVYDLRVLLAADGAGAERLLTLNPSDFERFGVPGVAILAP